MSKRRIARQHQAERLAGRRGDSVGKRIAQRWSREAKQRDTAASLELTPAETQRRVEIEHVFHEARRREVRAGMALAEIRDKQLYRETHATFAAYVKDCWDMTWRDARRLMDAAGIVN